MVGSAGHKNPMPKAYGFGEARTRAEASFEHAAAEERSDSTGPQLYKRYRRCIELTVIRPTMLYGDVCCVTDPVTSTRVPVGMLPVVVGSRAEIA